MTEVEIIRTVELTIPAELRARYGHLSYLEMAEVAELAPWAELLRWLDEVWARAAAEAAGAGAAV